MIDYLELQKRLELQKGLPYTEKWSAAADFMELIVNHCLQRKPSRIMECSSGLTTLMLARCCQINSHGHVYSLENGEEYAANTRTWLNKYGLESYATVIYAPLEDINLKGIDFSWYSMTQLPDTLVDMLVVDGPPGFLQSNSRYPALPILIKRLIRGCKIFLDDAAREDEKRIAEYWQSEFPNLQHEYLELERGCSVFTFSG